MKALLILASVGAYLFAGTTPLYVKKADVKISVNGQTLDLKKDSKVDLNPGSAICFLEGDGKVRIGKRKQLSKKSKKCYSTPIPKDFKVSDFVTDIANSTKVALVTGKSKVSYGVSTKSTQTNEVITGEISIKDKKEIIIYNELFGPLPVTLKVYDEKKDLVQEFVNEEEVTTLFRVPTSILKENYSMVIINAFEEELLNQKIIK